MRQPIRRQLLLRHRGHRKRRGGRGCLTCRQGFWRDGMAPERLLKLFELREQAQWVQGLGNAKQLVLLVGRYDPRGEQALHRRLCLIVGPVHLVALALFGLELHRRLKAVDIQAQGSVQFGELSVRQFADKAIIADHLPHNLPILLLHITLVIALSGTSPGEGNVCLFTKSQQFDIDKLRAIVRVKAEHRERKQVLGALEGCDDHLLTSVEQRQAFGPAGGNVSQGQGVQEQSIGLIAAVSDQVGFQKPGLDLIPLLEGANRDLLFEQRARSGRREPMAFLFVIGS